MTTRVTMKAVVCTRYGAPDVLEFVDRPKPIPAPDEILIRTRATTVSSGDWRIRSLEMPPGFAPLARLIFGFFRPRQPILGSEIAGEIEAVGSSVKNFTVGERVVAFDGTRLGGHAEFRVAAETGNVVRLPEGIDFTTAAALPFGATTAWDFLRRANLAAGEKILIIGASGSVGSAAVQLSRLRGARVTGVCGPNNVELVKSLGAERMIDYSREDVTALGAGFDVVLETTGALNLEQTCGLLARGGRTVLIAGGLGDLISASWRARSRGFQAVVGPAAERREDLEQIVEMTARGQFQPVIERVYPFARIADAHARVGERRKRGNLVITIP